MASACQRENLIRDFREVLHYRYNYLESERILEHVHWHREDALNFVTENEPDIVRRIASNSQRRPLIETDHSVIKELKDGNEMELRQFACENCDHFWWYRVPFKKEVAKCRKCLIKYDPVPKDREWGWAEFNCKCNHQFRGYGQMSSTSSPCYVCNRLVEFPSRIIHDQKITNRISRYSHSCEASNCFRRSHRHTSNRRGSNICVHPKSAHRKRVLYPSKRHISTGSTITTSSSLFRGYTLNRSLRDVRRHRLRTINENDCF